MFGQLVKESRQNIVKMNPGSYMMTSYMMIEEKKFRSTDQEQRSDLILIDSLTLSFYLSWSKTRVVPKERIPKPFILIITKESISRLRLDPQWLPTVGFHMIHKN